MLKSSGMFIITPQPAGASNIAAIEVQLLAHAYNTRTTTYPQPPCPRLLVPYSNIHHNIRQTQHIGDREQGTGKTQWHYTHNILYLTTGRYNTINAFKSTFI